MWDGSPGGPVPTSWKGGAVETQHVVVVGGGIAGVAAAHELRSRRPDLTVTLLEGSPQLGGKLALAEVAGVVIDVGAEAVLQRRPEGVDLARSAGLGDDVVHPATITASLWNRGSLQPMPRSLMGVPGDLDVLRGVLSDEGFARAAQGRVVDALADGDDVSVGDLVADQLGEEVVQRLVEPMLGGVYAGHAHALSARAAVPGLVRALDGTRSLIEAATAAMTPASPNPAPVFAGLRGGVGRLPGAVATASGATVRCDAMV
ncbi:MAG: protoporphyrinogen oxidase, partial [Nocardioidaceae bacterium]|nr:protoporphyrinogen oxidase [Nocardioidaceae bacterium]